MDESNKIIGIVVGILVSVIIVGIVFALVAFGNSAKDDSMDDLAAAMGQMDQAKFDKFDNGMLSGSQITAALTEFKGTPVIFIVETKNGSKRNYLARDGGVATPAHDAADSVSADFGTDPYVTGPALAMDWDSSASYNVDFRPTKNSASADFIKTTAKFDCKLIKDANDQTIGIYAKQRP